MGANFKIRVAMTGRDEPGELRVHVRHTKWASRDEGARATIVTQIASLMN